jgi:hypothetical protein
MSDSTSPSASIELTRSIVCAVRQAPITGSMSRRPFSLTLPVAIRFSDHEQKRRPKSAPLNCVANGRERRHDNDVEQQIRARLVIARIPFPLPLKQLCDAHFWFAIAAP